MQAPQPRRLPNPLSASSRRLPADPHPIVIEDLVGEDMVGVELPPRLTGLLLGAPVARAMEALLTLRPWVAARAAALPLDNLSFCQGEA